MITNTPIAARLPATNRGSVARVGFSAIPALPAPRRRHRLWPLISVAAVCLLPALSLTVYAIAPSPVSLPNDPPMIVSFTGWYSLDGHWTFEGTVIDENPGGLTITFGGLLDGHQTLTNRYGHFMYRVQVSGPGTVSAHTIDDQQQGSNHAVYEIW